jgi:serine/threonine protein phosphatase PrpC
MASAIQSMSPREAIAWLIDRARERAHGGGDNLSIALIRIDPKA